MKFATIEPAEYRLSLTRFKGGLRSALRAVGLELGKTDHGIIWRGRLRRVGIIVGECSLYVPARQQSYFSIEARLYAGNAILYAFDMIGETVDLEPPLPPVEFYRDSIDVEFAIQRGHIMRPKLVEDGKLKWVWPNEMTSAST